ncbi:MAG TPA: DEAD/DEAH box helicase [Chthoniobacterales bacterium]|jgi:ATP-dependent Lhr-like helicase|nr:DEAD/DEAH box helicase [Chthoniobacterales bacterium]
MSAAAFARLHSKIQEAVWQQQWDELRPLQVEAIHAVLDSDDHVILAAATASGKTEAAFLPILSQLAAEPLNSVQALYVSPLKALINDQFRRLEDLCSYAEIPVHRWHGDVSATDKQHLRKSPGGVLLITPESLESQFINHDRHLARIYANLRFVVIDELHAFIDNVRGIHLRSLLARLAIAAGVAPRRIGLSATLGDFTAAKEFLCVDAPCDVRLLEDRTSAKELRLGLKAYIEPLKAGESEVANPSTALPEKSGLGGIAVDIAQRFRAESNLIFCNSRRQTELLADKLRLLCESEQWPRDPFLLHHGSLSRELREDAERELKAGHPVTAICTSTLEMGIDIGAVRSVGQVGPTWSVTSLVQRLGRSGRREGEPQILRIYTLDEPLTQHSSLSDRLFPELVRAIALVELHREGWLEPPQQDRFHFSTCVHQVLSVLRQTGGASAARLFDVLCARGAFRHIHSADFATLVRGLAAKELIEQVPTGELILSPAGERIAESRDFYASFASRIEYRVEHNGNAIGLLPQDNIPAEGEFLLLAGRRWKVDMIDHASKRVAVSPAKSWKQPRFVGGIGGVHPVVMSRMKRVLMEDGGYAYLNERARQFLGEARETFRRAGLRENDTVTTLAGVEWFPWNGSRVLLTLELCARAAGVNTERNSLCLRYQKLTATEFAVHRAAIAAGEFTADELMPLVRDQERDRFDEHVPEELLQKAFIAEVLHLPGAEAVAAMNDNG